jgi:hypothetical protein
MLYPIIDESVTEELMFWHSEGALTDHPKYRVINERGELMPGQFDGVGESAEGLLVVRQNGRWGYINHKAEFVIKPQFRRAESFSEGLAAVMNDQKKWGFINRSGEYVVAPQYDYTTEFSEGLAGVGRNPSVGGYVDQKGNVVIPIQFYIIRPFQNGLARVADREGRNRRYIDRRGEVVLKPESGIAQDFQEGFARVEGKDYSIDGSGKILADAHFDDAEDFSEGLAAVKVKGRWGYIDRQGKMVIEPKFGDLERNFWVGSGRHSFRDGRALVRTETGAGFIDRAGKLVIRLKRNERAGRFKNGATRFVEFPENIDVEAPVPPPPIRLGYMDTSGKVIYARRVRGLPQGTEKAGDRKSP